MATPADAGQVLEFVRRLAAYEKLQTQVTASASDIRKALESGRLEAAFAEFSGKTAGFITYYETYTTFRGRPKLFLEDIFVVPEMRRHGLARLLLMWLRTQARERGCSAIEWLMLDWNEPARRFYQTVGAKPIDGWEAWSLSIESDAPRPIPGEGGA